MIFRSASAVASAWRRRPRVRTLLAALACAAAACDGGARTPDAQARRSAESAEVSVRFDATPGRPATVQVLAFHATATAAGAGAGDRPDVLGIVDPLAAAAPEQGCVLRDVGAATAALAARGGAIELREMTGIGVGLVGTEALLRPFPRLYPDVATVVGGVVAEAGPQPLAMLPDHVSLYTAESELPVADLAVPVPARLIAVNGTAVSAGLRASAQEALSVTVGGGAGGLLELRPFGATLAVACTVPAGVIAETVVSVPRPLVAALVSGGTTPVAASLEVARRGHLRQSMAAPSTRVSVEVRVATTLELRP